MKTAKQVLDKIIIGMPDDDRMKDAIILAMEEYAKLCIKSKIKALKKCSCINCNRTIEDVSNALHGHLCEQCQYNF